MNVSRRRVALTTAAVATALLAPAAADAAGSREPTLLTVSEPRQGTKDAPVTLRVRVPAAAALSVRVNGRRAHTGFDDVAPGVRVGHLSVHHGLRPGRNRIVLRARRTDGRHDVATRTVTVPRRPPIADAGADRRAVMRMPVELGTATGGHRGAAGDRSLRWRVVQAPRRARATLAGSRSATPSLTASRPGHYVVRMTARSAAGVSHDTANVVVVPDDLPIGVPVETLSSAADGMIRVASAPIAGTADRSGIAYAVLDRRTRSPLESGTVSRDRAGIATLAAIADRRSGTLGNLMIVSTPAGLPRPASPFESDYLGDLLRKLGGDLTADQRADVFDASDPAPLSIIGVPGGAPGGAWVNVPTPDQADRSGNIAGFLRVNSATDQYGYVPGDQPAFDTRAADRGETESVIEIAGQRPYQVLTGELKNGFHVVAVDSTNLRVLTNVSFTDSLADTARMAKTIRDAATQRRPYPIVVVQSIGRPKAKADGWDEAAQVIQELGGTRLTFDALAGEDEYALVGRWRNGPGAESSTLTYADRARIVGNLTRGTDYTYVPVSSGPETGVNRELTAIVTQPPSPFPAFDTAGKKAAETWIAKRLALCDDVPRVQSCPVRPHYYRSYQSSWSQLSTDLADDQRFAYPGDRSGFTATEYAAVRGQLKLELSAVSRVRSYFDNLQKPLMEAREQGAIDVKKIGNTLLDQLGAKDGANATSWWLGLSGKIASLGGALPAQYRGAAAGIAAVLGLSSYLTADDGRAQLGKSITVKATALSEELRLRLVASQRSITGIALLVVSDYGKLTATAAKVNTDDWRLAPDSGVPLQSIDLASRRWFAEQLVPAAFPWLVRGTPPPLGPPVARAITCRAFRTGGYGQPWSAYPPVAEFRTPTNWYPDQTPIEPTFFFSRAGINTENISPSPALANLLFNPVNPATGALGLSKLDFLSPRVFPIFGYANDQATTCGLPA